MNLVLDDAEELNIKQKSRKVLGTILPAIPYSGFCVFEGRILLKGDNIALIMNTQGGQANEMQQ